MLLEQGELSSGTTWHAAGLVGQLRANESSTRLVQYSTELYSELENEVGLSTGFKRCGGVTVARTEDRMTQLRRTAATAEAFDLECELLSPEQALEHYPGDAGRRPRRCDLAARRRQGEPDRPDRGDGPGRSAERRPGLRAHARPGRARAATSASPAYAPTRVTSRPRSSSTAPASGRRRSATSPGSTCRCTPPSTSTWSPTRSRACTPTCPCSGTPTATPTSRRRSAGWSSAGSSPTRSRGCRRTRSPTRSSSSCSRRTGTTSRR